MNKFWECNSSGGPGSSVREAGRINHLKKDARGVYLCARGFNSNYSVFKAHTDMEKHSMADCNHTYTQPGPLPFFVFLSGSCLWFLN